MRVQASKHRFEFNFESEKGLSECAPATRVQATQLESRLQSCAHWAALWVWGMTLSGCALKLT